MSIKIALIGIGASSGGLRAVMRDILSFEPPKNIQLCLFCSKGFLTGINICYRIKVVETQFAFESKLERLVRQRYNRKFIQLVNNYNPDAVFYITGSAKRGLENYKSYIILNNQLYADIPLILKQGNWKLELGLVNNALQFRKNSKWMDGVFFSSVFSKEHATPIINTKKSFIVPFACNSIFYSNYKKKQFSIDKRRPKLLCIGSLIPYKNQKYVILALKELHNRGINARITFVGTVLSKKYYQECLNLVKRNRLDKYVTFREWVAFEGIPEIIDKHDIYINSSEIDTCGTSVEEGMARGVPVIANDVGFNREMLDENGIYIRIKEYKSLADAVEKYLNDEAFVQLCIDKARRHSERRSLRDTMNDYMNYIINDN